MNPYIFKRKDEPIAIINLTEDGSIVNYKLNSKYERYICGTKKDCRIGDKFTKATILLLFSFTN